MTEFRNLSFPILAVILILTIGTAAKIYLNASAELRQAEENYANRLFAEAATHYERSIRWFLPGLSAPDRAAEGLWKTASFYESQGDAENALAAYRRLRGAFYSARSFFTPGQKWIDRCNDKIAALMAGGPPFSEADKSKSFEQRKSEVFSVLAAERPPFLRWALLAEAGFFGWVACALLFIAKAVTPSGHVRSRPALFWSAALAAFYALWLWGMANA